MCKMGGRIYQYVRRWKDAMKRWQNSPRSSPLKGSWFWSGVGGAGKLPVSEEQDMDVSG